MDVGEDDNSVISRELPIFIDAGRFAASRPGRQAAFYITALNASMHAMFAMLTTIRLSSTIDSTLSSTLHSLLTTCSLCGKSNNFHPGPLRDIIIVLRRCRRLS